MDEEEALAWVWAAPTVGQVFAETPEECRVRLESRRQLFGHALGLPTGISSGASPAPQMTHLGSKAAFFHVAGTNGKGSVCAILEACLSAIPNKTVGVFTSPHLHSFRERIRVNRQLMAKDRVVPLIEKAKQIAGNEGGSLNFFDKFLLVAFLYFEEQKVDYVVLETGLGGRWDPTNVIEGPALKVSIITSISMDHQEVLGDTITQIAWQKAGIIKPGTPVVTMASQAPDVLQVFRDEACLRKTSLTIVPSVDEEAVKLLGNRLEGDIQKDNVTLAIAGLRIWWQAEDLTAQIGVEFSSVISAGLPTVYHPCRFETFRLPVHILQQQQQHQQQQQQDEEEETSIPIVIDGGHNEDGLRKLFAYARKRFADKRIVTVFGCGLYERKFVECLHIAYQCSDRIILVVSSHFKSAPVPLLQQKIEQLSGTPSSEDEKLQLCVDSPKDNQPSVADGMRTGIALAQQDSKLGPSSASSSLSSSAPFRAGWVMIVCGSLFVAADGREFLASLIRFPPHDWVHHADHKHYVYK